MSEPIQIPGADLKNTRVTVIDADSIAYIVGWNHQAHDEVDRVIDNVDDFIHSILQAVQASYYIGVLSGQGGTLNFRHSVAKTKVYKGNRGEKPEWYQKWAPIIEDHLLNTWKFIRTAPDIETDDLVVTLHQYLAKQPFCTAILSGNDKDTRQSHGHHYDFRKNVGDFVMPATAAKCLYTQVLTGDTTDNIPGLPKCGPVGAEKILSADNIDHTNYPVAVLWAYIQKLGEDQGIQQFYENYMLCKLRHDLEINHTLHFYDLKANEIRLVDEGLYTEEEEILPELPEDLFSAD